MTGGIDIAYIFAGAVFVIGGLLLGLIIGWPLRRAAPGMSGRAFVLIVPVCAVAATLVLIEFASAGLQGDDGVPFSFIGGIQWGGWLLLLAEALTALLVARRLRPRRPPPVDPSTFE